MAHRHNDGRTLIAQPTQLKSRLASPPWLVLYWLLLGLTIVWLYWPALRGDVPAFRDAFHFYYPLECWLAARAEAGEYLPHFNPYDGTGENVIGETSSGLCYPGRFLWWIPGLSVAQRLGLVLAVHTSMAAVGAAYAARRMNLRPSAGALAATAYALGGAVLFQHANPIYLIGAAWTPWALAESWMLVHHPKLHRRGGSLTVPRQPHGERQPRMAVWVGATTLMLLGGDPQATANAGIVALLALATRLSVTRSWNDLLHQLRWLAGAVAIVGGLTAMQWIPAAHWLMHHQRAEMRGAMNARESVELTAIPKLLRPLRVAPAQNSAEDNLVPRSGRATYDFSIAPWHLLTLVWSTGGGHFLPEHTRWLQALPSEPRMWTPSLSVGLLSVLCIAAGWSQRSTRRRQRFLIVVIVIAGAAMLGNFAPTLIVRQALQALGADEWSRRLPGDEFGGAYWCFTQLIPGYSAFRYPAKWSVWFTCGLALAAADALDRRAVSRRAFLHLCSLVAVLSLTGAAAVIWLRWAPGGKPTYVALSSWLAASSDPWLGHPDVSAVTRLWLQTTLVAAVLSGAGAIMVRWCHRPQRIRAVLLLLTLAELGWAGKNWLVTVDMNRLDPNRIVDAVQTVDSHSDSARRLWNCAWAGVGRADFGSWYAAQAFPTESPRERVERTCTYQLLFRLGKLHLLERNQGNLTAIMSLTPRALSTMRYRLAQADDLRANNPALDEALAWLGVSQRLTAGAGLTWRSVSDVRPIVELFADGQAGDGTSPSGETCTVESVTAERLRVHVSSPRASQLVVRLLQDGGWAARLTQQAHGAAGAPTSLHRIPSSTHLGLFQSLSIPAGEWTIDLSYRTPGWRTGVAISLCTLGLCLALGGGRYYRSKRLASGQLA